MLQVLEMEIEVEKRVVGVLEVVVMVVVVLMVVVVVVVRLE